MRYLSFLFFVVWVLGANAQNRFYKLYSGSGFDKGEDVLALPDSSFLVAGSSGSWEENAQGFLMKIDQNGAYQWSQAYGAQETEEIKRVFHLPGVGYYLAGMSNSWSSGDYDPMLVFTDLNGNQQWIKTYQHPSWERIHDGVQTIDSGFVLVGERQALLAGSADVLLLRLNQFGDTLWTKTIGTAGDDRAYSILRTVDSSYIVGGEWYVADSSCTKGFVCKISDTGQLIWFDTLGNNIGAYGVLDLAHTPFGYQFAGYHTITNDNHDKFSGMIAIDGSITAQNAPIDGAMVSNDIIQQITYVQQLDACAQGIQVQNQGTYPESYDLNIGYGDALFGYWLGWPVCAILNQGYDYCGNIKPTLDGGFIAVGMNSVIVDGQNQLNGGSNIFVLKVNGDGSAYVQTDTVFTTNQLVGIKPVFEGSKVLAFPNPVSADLTIVWPGNEAKAIELYNAQGALLLKETVAAPYGIPMTTFASGLYLLKLEGQSYPIIKQ
jgi:hypothetical protein